MYLENDIPPESASIPLFDQTSLRLVLNHQELEPIVKGSNLPRTSWESPLCSVGVDEVWAIAGIADSLTGIEQDAAMSLDKGADPFRSRENYVTLPVRYKEQTIRALGTWTRRRIEQMEREATDNRTIAAVGWVAFELDRLRRDRQARRVTRLRILPIDPAFWKGNRVQ
jgi:hypothetical protein